MNKQEVIQEIERIKISLDHHFQKYIDCKYDSNNASRKNIRDKASKDMITYASFIQTQLCHPLIFHIISSGNSFQFEDFWRYVQSDMPDYLDKINTEIEKLKSEAQED
jgi:hypothetical protein